MMDGRAYPFLYRIELSKASSRGYGLPFRFSVWLHPSSPLSGVPRCAKHGEMYLRVKAVTLDLPNLTWTHQLFSRPRAEKATETPLCSFLSLSLDNETYGGTLITSPHGTRR